MIQVRSQDIALLPANDLADSVREPGSDFAHCLECKKQCLMSCLKVQYMLVL